MPHDLAREVHAALADVPLGERVVALVVSIVMQKQEPIRVCTLLAGVIGMMAHYLSTNNRNALSEVLRDVADYVGHREREPV